MKKPRIPPHLRSLRLLLTLGLISLLTSLSSAQQSGTSPVKIYLLVGQSNMEGKGQINGLTTQGTLEYIVANEPATYGFLQDGNGDWIVRDDVWMHFERSEINLKTGGLTPGYGGSDSLVGPEIGFGHGIGDTEGNQVLLIKTAWGGKSLGNDFLPPSSGPYPAPQKAGDAGFYYAEMLRIVEDTTSNLSTYFPDYNGQGYEIAGLCFHQGYNDQFFGLDAMYETNLVNFINDIRSNDNGLGVPGLPIVIATSGMPVDGLTLVKQAQLAMTDTVKYPDFDGNVAVIDTEQPYTEAPYTAVAYPPLGLVFGEDPANSPITSGQQFHWNQNARTYTNIGLAMANEMPLLTVPRCPSRLRATGTDSGVVLSWQNGSETPTSVEILRDGVTIAATAPSTPALFTDTTALPGVYAYEIRFTMPVTPCEPLTVSHDSGIKNLIAYRGATGVVLEWQNNLGYAGIEIQRNGVVVEAALAGTAVTYTDTAAPATGVLIYSLVPTDGTSTPAEVQINLGPHDSGGALIYEPFDYPATAVLAGNTGATGTTGAWSATVGLGMDVTPSGLSFGSLPVTGNKLDNIQFGRENKISLGTTLADAGLLADGATLWFSLLVKPLNSANVGSKVILGNSLASSSGVGIDIGNTRLNYRVVTNGTGVNNVCSNGGLSLLKTQLLVGKLTWGTGGADDSFLLYLPGTDLTLGDASRSADPFNVDQSSFDQIAIFMQNSGTVDEIRFGASYESVIGEAIDTSGDFTAPTPNQMSWSTPPAAVSESSISMTAVTASDANGIEYLFTETSDNPGGSSSGWQLSSSFTDTGLNPGTTYSYTVQARDRSVNLNTNTASSPAAQATTFAADMNPPPTPTLVTPLAPVTSTEISLTANPVTDPEGKSVEYRFNNLTNGTDSGWLSSPSPSPSHTETGLTPETSYSFTVQARDTATNPNVSPSSAVESATTLSPPPPGDPALSVGSTTLLANQSNGTYDVSVNNSDAFIRADSGLGGTTIDLTGTIVDYAMPASGNNGAASVIGAFTFSENQATRGAINLWTTSDPSTDPVDAATAQQRMDNTVSGSFDISSLTAGTIYFLQGAFAGDMDLAVTMSDTITANPDVVLTQYNLNSNDGPREEQYAVPLSFDDAGGYDTITYTWTANGGSGRFGGVIMSVPVSAGTPPTLAGSDIVDNRSGAPLAPNALLVTYTVTFSENMDDSTVEAADFGNAGTASLSIGTVTETSPGVFSVPVTPTSVGTLQLQVNQSAVLSNPAGNDLDTSAAILDDTAITVQLDITDPLLSGSDMVDDQSGGPVLAGSLVTYTMTFSEDMDDTTVDASDFGNAGSASINIGSITEVSPGVFTVEISPTSAGTLQLQVLASAVLNDAAGLPLDTSSAILADTIITVQAGFSPAGVQRLRVVLVGGQSNADGRATTSGLPISPIDLQQPQEDVDFYYKVQGGSGTLTTLRPGLSETGNFGPAITCGRLLAQELGDGISTRVAIVKYANGGTNLQTQWAGGGDDTTSGDGTEYVTFQQTVTGGLAALATTYPNAVIELAGMIWLQGESDAKNGFENNYEANLTAFISDVRATYGADFRFVVIRLSNGQTNIAAGPLGIMRAAQTAVAAADPLTALADTDGFGMKGDNLHFDALGQQQIGEASAIQLLDLYPFHSALAIAPEGGGNIEIKIDDAFTGFLYTLSDSGTLLSGDWAEIDSATATGRTVRFSVTPSVDDDKRFYRVERTKP